MVALAPLIALGCASGSSEQVVGEPEMSVVVDGLDRPTQISPGPDGLLLVAQLAGGENDATGEVVAVDVADGTRRVVVEGLDKPTGVLWEQGALWVMVRQGLLRFDWTDPADLPGDAKVVLDGLPFNGRSEGTLTSLADGRILYATTGTTAGGEPVDGSGTLWAFDPTDGSSTPLAVGLKNAYAHALLDDGSIVITEIGDGGTTPPLEEVDVVDVGGPGSPPDFGWPGCPGDDDCAGVVRPLAVFPVASTPTGIATVGDDIYVALFVAGQLMRIDPVDWVPGDEPVEAVEVAAGLQGPHTILAQPDGTLWISEHLADRVISIRP
jgi:glucose/arabinose dehydrogenase